MLNKCCAVKCTIFPFESYLVTLHHCCKHSKHNPNTMPLPLSLNTVKGTVLLPWWDPDVTFYSQLSHLSCCRGRLLAALMQGRNFTLVEKPLLWSKLTLIITLHLLAEQTERLRCWTPQILRSYHYNHQTQIHAGWRGKTAGSIQYINIVEQSVIVTEPETVTVLKSGLQKPICLVLTAHKQFFLYPARERERGNIAFWEIDLMLIVKVK